MCTRIEHHLPRGQVLRAGLAFYPGPSQVFSTSTSHLSSGPSFPCNVSSPLHLLDLSHSSRSGSGISWTILAAYLSGRTGPPRPHAGSGGHSQAAGNQRRVLARRYHNPKAAAKILWQPPGHLARGREGRTTSHYARLFNPLTYPGLHGSHGSHCLRELQPGLSPGLMGCRKGEWSCLSFHYGQWA